MTSVQTPQTRCRLAFGRCDITPPIGIYHRMWGAALHDRASGIHRPLEATLLWLEPLQPEIAAPQLIFSLDHCILDTAELAAIRRVVATSAGTAEADIQITLSHTHGAGWMSRSRSALPGGELLGPYLDELAGRLAQLAGATRSQVRDATLIYRTGRCQLAAHRDFYDSAQKRFVCGFNPAGPADDTLLVAAAVDSAGQTLGTIVNYACHPTTLAWDNTLISPDWVGAMRETVESATGAPCLFLQGASGDLGPREGFVGDPAVADRNGREVGYAALSALATLPPAGTEYRYAGSVTSGTQIGTWQHQRLPDTRLHAQAYLQWRSLTVELPYRHDLPTIDQTAQERDAWQQQEAEARRTGDEPQVRNCRAQVEQRTRQLTRLNALAPGRTYPLNLRLGSLGDAIWILVPGELYQAFQLTLRERCAPRPVVVATLSNDWQPGYIPPAAVYGYQIYQEVIAATSAGALELLIEAVSREILQNS
jgi:hypothetical protein